MSDKRRMLRVSCTCAVILLLSDASFGAPGRSNSGQSSSTIVFTDQPGSGHVRNGNPNRSNGGHSAETDASTNLFSNGTHQLNEGEASSALVFSQTSPDGQNVQTANINTNVHSNQQSEGGGGNGGGTMSANNSANVNVFLHQTNANNVVNVERGHEGVVIVNDQGTPNEGHGGQTVVNNRPISPTTSDSSGCRYTCRTDTIQLYCCDDGSDPQRNQLAEEIHGGFCPPARHLCPQGGFFKQCAHDGQCPSSDKCCYDTCARHHICKRPDEQQRLQPANL